MEGVKQKIWRRVSIEGTAISSNPESGVSSVQIFVNGEESPMGHISHEKWRCETTISRPERLERFPEIGQVPKNQFMIVVIASLANGRCAASMFLLD
jgi:hypothetical protein